MLYVQNILENLKYRFNVLVVSNCSYVITQLLITKLTNHYINWNIIDTVTYSDLKTSNYDGVDLIISTTLLNDKDLDIPYFYVDALLIEKDMEWLDISIDKLNYSRDFINNKTDLKKYFIMLIYLGIQIEFDDDYSLNLNDKDLIQSKISNYSIKVHKRNKSKITFYKRNNNLAIHFVFNADQQKMFMRILYKCVNLLSKTTANELKTIINNIKIKEI